MGEYMRFFKGFVVFSLAMVVFSVTGCDLFTAGLGAKVDLAPPVAKIISPAPNTYVNADSFTVTGTASDDSGSPNLTVRVKNASGSVVQTLNVSPDSAGNWSITFKTRKAADQTNALADGQYTIDVTASDDKGKTQNTYTSVIIDTLPPTVLVTSPLYKSGSQYTEYIDIKGEVYDANAIKDVQVSLLKDDGTVLAGPTVADGTNTWTIRFELKDKIQELVDKSEYLYNVVVTDAAGNQNTYYFHREDIVTLKNKHNSEALFPATDEIGKIDQLGMTGPTSGITPEELKTEQLSNVNSFGSFKYLQDPQIEFQFTNIDPTKGYEENLLPPKSKISGIIQPPPGNDNPIETSSIIVEIYDYSNSLKNTISYNSESITLIKVGEKAINFALALVDSNGVELFPGRYSIKMKAQAGNVKSVTNQLQFMIDAEAPYFEETNIDANNMFRNKNFTMSFDGSHSTNIAKIEIYESKGNNDFPLTPNETITAGLPALSFTGKQSSALPYDASPTDGLYKYRAVMTTASGKTATLLRSIYYDTTAPKVEITSFDKLLTGNKVNKTINFNAIAGDTYGVEGVKYFVSTDGTTAPAYAATVGGPVVQVLAGQSINTTSLTDGQTYYLWVVAKDKAGNEGNSTAQQFVVDQSTDIPVVTFTSVNPAYTTEAQAGNNLLVSGGKISGSITDDDGLPGSATIYIDKNKNGDFGDAGETISLTLTGSGLTKSFDYDVSGLTDGTYQFKLDVADTTGAHNNAMTPVWFAYDTAVPTVVFNANAADSKPVGPYRNGDFTVQGTVQDANGISKVEFSLDNGNTWVDLGITATAGEEKAWSKAISAASNNGAKSLLVRATDTFERTGLSDPVAVTIDTTAPTVSITNPGTFVAGPSITITGESTESGMGISGIATVQYRIDGGSWQIASGTATWLASIDLDTDGTGSDTGLSEGSHTLEVQAIDKAGNQGSIKTISIMVDQNTPVHAVITIDGETFGESSVYRTTGFTLAGTVTDTNGVASVTITQTKEGGSSENVNVTLNTGTTSRTWTAPVTLSGEGSYTYTITVTDVAGRSTTVIRKVIVDTQAPTAPTVTDPVTNKWILGTSYPVSGSASDVGSAGIGAVYYVAGPAMGYTPPADLASWSKANGTDSWSGTINLTDLGEGPKKLYVKAVDKAGNVSTQTEVPFGIDQSAPTISLTGPGNDLVNGTITFTGTASDSYLVALITVAEKKPGDTGFTDIGTATYDSGTGTWSYARPISGLSDGFYEYRITVTDGAMKIATVTKTITIDTTGPAISFNQPAPYIEKSGTVYGNGTMTMSGTASDANGLASLAYRVGGGSWQSVGSDPYTTFSFIVDTTDYTDKADLVIEVQGTDKAGNSGVASYTIRVDQDTDKPTWTITSPTEGGLVASQTITISGNLADDDGLNDTTLYYRLSADGGTTWSPDWTQISASYLSGSATSKTLSSFSFTNSIDGSKVLELKITDVNGTVGTKSITFTQDAGAPTISNISPSTTGYRNGDFTVSGTATDTTGTVAAVRYRVVKDGATVVVNWADCTLVSPNFATTGFTTGLIPTSNGTGIYQVTFETEDDAGNKRQESYAYTVDVTAPSGTIASPANGSTTNNVITLSGTSSDNYGVSALRLAIIKGGTEVANLGAPTGTTDWNFTFDTRNYDDTTYATLVSGSLYTITLRLIVTDVAGNSTNIDRTFQIDQSTDVPQVSFTSAQNVYLSDSMIYGTATDDDGIASIEVSTDGGTNWTTLSAPTGGWGTSASWNYDLGSTDGAYSLRVRVTDVSSPAIVGTSSDATFLVDREAPDGAFTAPAANSKLKASDLTFTGTYGDENPVVSVQLKIDSSDFTSGAVTATMSGGSGSTSGTWTYTFATIPDGTRTIYARVTDAAGRTTLISRTVVVDTTGPVVTIIDPADLTSVYGKVSIRGSAEDATTTVKNIKIGIGKTVNEADYEGSPWYPATGTVSWSYTFNNINAYANTTYAVDIGDTDQDGVQDAGETWLNIWRMKIYIRAEDTAGLGSTGNISYVSTYTLEIDPNRDRPEVTVLDPDDGATIGGYKRVFGIAQDGQSIWKVQIAFDMNNDGDFTDAGDVWPSISGFTPPAADESDSSTTAWYVVNGTTSWYQTINLYGEFNPTGTETTRTIKFKVRAWDYKTTPGDGIPGIEVVRTITFDKTVPQYSNISHETGSTVGGSFTITGYVRDESGLQSIIFKHEGPRISSQELIGALPGQPRAVLVNSGEPGYVAGYVTYRLEIPINTTEAGLFPASSGIMAVALDAIDSSGFHSILSLSFNVDNIQPSLLTYTAGSEIIGTQAEVQGTVRDTGIVSGIKQVVVYLKRGTSVLRLKGGSGSLDASGVLNLSDSAYNDYRIVIDNRLEDGNDTGSAGDNDGFAEWLTISGGVYNWAARFNSTLVSDGKTEVNYVAYDFAGNTVSGTTNAYVANNKPSITSIVLGTDLNGDGSVADTEKTSPISSGYSATNFTARGNRLYIQVNAAGGNGTKRYSITYNGIEQNGSLTSNMVTINTSSFAESSSANDRFFTILVYDSTTSDDDDSTDELTATITVGLTIDNVDEVAPTAWLYQLEASDVKDYNASDRSAWKGHIEPWNQSPYNNQDSGFNKTNEVFGNDADVSGTIVFRGGASDNQRISALSLWIDLDGDGDEDDGETKEVAHFDAASQALVPTTNTLGTWNATSQSLTLDGGHTVEWTFEWNSSIVEGVAQANVRIRVRAEDARARPAESGGPNGSVQNPANPTDTTSIAGGFNIMKVDVVPYITSLQTTYRTEGGLKDSNIRSSSGKYSVITGENASFITVNGFNLDPSAVRIVNTGSLATATSETGIGLAYGAPNGTYTSISLTNASTASGYLELFTNSVRAPNNIDNDTLPTNCEPDQYVLKNKTLTNDRYIRFFTIRDTGIKNAYYPDMVMESDDPVFGYLNMSGGPNAALALNDPDNSTGAGTYYPSHAMPQRAKFTAAGSQVYKEYLIKASIWDQMAMAKDAGNRYYHITIYNRDACAMSFIYDRYAELYTTSPNGTGTGWGSGTTYSSYTNPIAQDNRSHDPNNNALTLERVDFGNGLLLGRYTYPKIQVKGNSLTGNASVYAVYYDDNTTNRDIIFRDFQVGTGALGNALYTGGTSQYGGAYAQNTNLTENSTNSAAYSTGRITAASSASKHFDFGVTSTNRIVIVYYDEFAGRLKMVYSNAAVDGSAPTTDPGWTTSTITFPSYVGNYVSMTIDASDGIHIAAYDSGDSNLVYMYISAYNSATLYSATVDQAFSVGNWTQIKLFPGTTIPYIAYYNATETGGRDAIKLAFCNSAVTTSNVPAGVDANGFVTGYWEFMTVPALTPPQGGSLSFKHVNLGFNTSNVPLISYLGTNLEFGSWLSE